MEEELELRLAVERVHVMGDHIGTLLPSGLVRRIRLPLGHPAWIKVGEAEREARSQGHVFVNYWRIRRSYTDAELDGAELIQLLPNCMFEPAGEECGTQYDYSAACSICGAGRIQKSRLRLKATTIPPRCDLAFTIARDEFVVSDGFASVIRKAHLTGSRLTPIESKGRMATHSWQQLSFDSQPLEVGGNTRFGVTPFDDMTGGRCPLGHIAGHAILSELSAVRTTWDGSDFNVTRQLVGLRMGECAPNPLIVVSRRCFQALRQAGMTGFDAEVVNLVEA